MSQNPNDPNQGAPANQPPQPPPPPPPAPGAYPPPPPPPGGYSGSGVQAGPGGTVLVDWPKRALGGLIDYVAFGVVVGFVVNLISLALQGAWVWSALSSLLSLGWWIYLGYKSGTTGITLGRSVAKTKLVSEETGQPIGVGNGILRQFAHLIDSIICYVGWLFPLWDAKRQTIADKIVKTVVIDNSADPNASKYTW